MKEEIKTFTNLLLESEFDAASNFISAMNSTGQDIKYLIYLSSDIQDGAGIATYTFLLHEISKNETILLHEIARDVLANNLCHITGAYEGAVYHAERVCKLQPDSVSSWELLLDIAANRLKSTKRQKIEAICNNILQLDPNNLKATIYIGNI